MNIGRFTNGELEPALSLTAQLEGFRRSDAAREKLLCDVIGKYEQLQEEHQNLLHDLESEKKSRRTCQSETHQLQRQLAEHHRHVESNAFVLALIDGDGVIFQDALLQAGEHGGSEAASRLQQEIRNHVSEYCRNASSIPVVVHVYASMDKLASYLTAVKLLERPSDLRAFAQSFSVNQPLFSVIDVGQGKERADHRIKEMLRTFSDNPTCKHIIFGGCHDNGYLLNLDQYKHNPTQASRITLLESTPATRGFQELPNFRRAQFESVFRTTPLPEKRPSVGNAISGSSRTSASGMPPPGLSIPLQSPKATTTPTPDQEPNIATRSPSPMSSATESISTPSITSAPQLAAVGKDHPNGTSWATVGKAGVADRNISIASTKPAPRRYILYNATSQRLDEPLPHVSRIAIQDLTAKMKQQGKNFCNAYHVVGKCRNPECKYLHGSKLTGEDLLALKYKARSLACGKPDCANIDCYLGHECGYERDHGGKCPYSNCHLRSTHGMDHTPKLKQWEDGKVAVLDDA
ncbi:C-x8-C-x5-C-x3-H type zinc finger protein [Delitschia confertaspora ATCC 74209]|uniref:C-x8-C-x5-C-x3-H type zinc finger protein n=1 Tax=Delitschia confertaspora ATCC 74209 TaxID=1513339 RepID=A0A9P4JRV2_9PLEO|nr:C-x8-C-x5-C-x3-H type zinc finger protein [Delitschia confertaspora ATCC 74209]